MKSLHTKILTLLLGSVLAAVPQITKHSKAKHSIAKHGKRRCRNGISFLMRLPPLPGGHPVLTPEQSGEIVDIRKTGL